ncbi:MAG: hypothetical protein ACE5GO_01465 [Anaerolineales bacterium]
MCRKRVLGVHQLLVQIYQHTHKILHSALDRLTHAIYIRLRFKFRGYHRAGFVCLDFQQNALP